MAALKLNARALAAYEAHLRRRAKLEERVLAAADRIDLEDDRVFEEIVAHMGLDERVNWLIDDRWLDEFGVVLLTEGPEDDGLGEEAPDADEGLPERRVAN